MKIKALSKEDFKEKEVIYFNNILDGFDNYEYIQLSPKNKLYEEIERNYIKYIECLFYLNDNKVIIDFYKNRLDESSIKYIENKLEEEDCKMFHDLMSCGENDSVFFEVYDISYIPLLTKLNLKEIFFVTMYFEKIKSTLWGNYNYSFPLFFDTKENEDKYKKIAKQNCLL